MSMHLLRWQGPKRTEYCRQHLLSVLDEWQREWSVSHSGPMSIGRSSIAGIGAGMQWWRSVEEGCGALLALPADAFVNCGRKLLGLGLSEESEMSRSVGTEAISDLMTRVIGGDAANVGMEKLPKAPSDVLLDERYGNIGFLLGLPFSRTHVFVDAEWCNKFVPISYGQAGPKLYERSAALAQAEVVINAKMNLGNLTLQESRNWALGEVLVTDVKTDGSVELAVYDKKIGAGVLCHRAESRAVTLSSV